MSANTININNVNNINNQKDFDKNIASTYGYDSLLTVVKLATLSFYEVGTKISFYDNKIFIQPPSYTQGATRKLYGNSKDEIVQLFVPIKQCIDKYIFKENNSYVSDILKLSIKGLELLQNTYSLNQGVVIQIQFLINIIKDSLLKRTYDYTFLKNIFGDYDEKHVYDELWNDLSINVLGKHLNNCNNEFKKLKKKDDKLEEKKNSELEESFLDQKSKLDGFIKAKEKRYSEFLNTIN